MRVVVIYDGKRLEYNNVIDFKWTYSGWPNIIDVGPIIELRMRDGVAPLIASKVVAITTYINEEMRKKKNDTESGVKNFNTV